jgi:hypothetical protein
MGILILEFIRSLLTLTPGELLILGVLGVVAWAWGRWILRNHRVPPDALEHPDQS